MYSLRGLASGLRKVLFRRFGHGEMHRHASSKTEVLVVGYISLFSDGCNGIQTSYLDPLDNNASNIHFLSWNPDGVSKNGARRSLISVVGPNLFRAVCGLAKDHEIREICESKFERVFFFLVLVGWVLSLNWVNYLRFAEFIKHEVKSTKSLRLIHCLHEFHPLSRVVWSVVDGMDVRTSTFQHATITPSKLWYFPTPAEIKCGYKFPDKFGLYESNVASLLKDHLITSDMFFAKSPRALNIGQIPGGTHSTILFCGSLAWWDNAVLFRGIERILKGSSSVCIRIRLHPNARLRLIDRLTFHFYQMHSSVTASSNCLSQDLADASLVVGVSSSVLLDADRLGIPSLGIQDSSFCYDNIASENVKLSEIEEFVATSERFSERSFVSLESMLSRFVICDGSVIRW